MTMHKRWTICAVAALLAAPFLVSSGAPYAAALAQGTNGPGASTSASQRSHSHGKLAARKPTTKTTPAATAQKELPPRVPFTADEDAASVIPGMPDARFWADSVADFK
jgi:hypothetical protein